MNGGYIAVHDAQNVAVLGIRRRRVMVNRSSNTASLPLATLLLGGAVAVGEHRETRFATHNTHSLLSHDTMSIDTNRRIRQTLVAHHQQKAEGVWSRVRLSVGRGRRTRGSRPEGRGQSERAKNQRRTGSKRAAKSRVSFIPAPFCRVVLRVFSSTHGARGRYNKCVRRFPPKMTTTLLVGSTPDALATELIRRIGAIATESVQARGVFNVAISGGSMPKVSIRPTSIHHMCHPYNVRLVTLAAFATPSESTAVLVAVGSVGLESWLQGWVGHETFLEFFCNSPTTLRKSAS